MPLSPLQLATIVQQQYDNVQGFFDYDFITEGDRLSIKQFKDCVVLVDEGSHDFLNWFYNFIAIAPNLRMKTVRFGGVDNVGVELGFDINMEASVAQTAPLLHKGVTTYCIGHSRGAGRAYLRAARLIALGFTDVRICVFGAPRPGDDVLQGILNKATEHWSFRNGKDPVCRVPYCIPPFLKYIEPVDFTMLNVSPTAADPWGHEFGWHHMNPNYITGMTAWQKEKDNGKAAI